MKEVQVNTQILRKRLVARRDALLAVTQRTKSAIRQTAGEVLDFMDNSVREAGTSLAAAEVQRLTEEYQSVIEAIERLDKNMYGLCSDCRNPISEMRLRAHPAAELCIECAERREEDRNPHLRPAISA